jgi:single-strand DNA-binding protein
VNEIPVTLVGNVVTDLTARTLPGGAEVVTFRFASTDRRFDRSTGRWVDGNTSNVQVSCWRQLARNVVASVSKGDPLLVTGRLRVRAWERDDRRGITVEVDASAVGHDLARGVTRFHRPHRPAVLPDGPERRALDDAASADGAEAAEGLAPPADATAA